MKRESLIWLIVICSVSLISCSVFAVVFFRSKPASVTKKVKRKHSPMKHRNQDSESARATRQAPVPSTAPIEPLAPVLGVVPQFQLTDQTDQSFGFDDLKGKVWIANFMFTRCEATCPMQTQWMGRIQRELQGQAFWHDVRLLSITVDPEYDQPTVLQHYADAVQADSSQWKFLTGDRDTIWALSKSGFRLPVADDAVNPKMPIAHDSKFVVVDRKGQIRGYFDVLKPTGFASLQKCLTMILPEIGPPKGYESWADATHLAEPAEIISSAWLQERQQAQRESAKTVDAFHEFRFHDRTADSGIQFDPQIVDDQRWRMQINHYDHGNGLAVADVDGDGRLDIYFPAQVGGGALYRNLGGGRFANITERAGVGLADRIGVTASFADVDNDGDADLFVTTVRNGNVLLENDGMGSFRDISEAAGVNYRGHSSGAIFFDYNRDGLVDLFVSNVGKYTTDESANVRVDRTSSLPAGEYPYYVGLKDSFGAHLNPERAEPSILYKNLGDRRFADVSQEVGLVDLGWSGDATPLDVNGDGWLDLYLLNMQGTDAYWENLGGTRFVEKTAEVFGKTPWGSMGAKVLDYDNDGKFDLYVTDMHSDMSEEVLPQYEKHKLPMRWPTSFLQSDATKSLFGNALYRNLGEGKFEEVSDTLGVENYWPWGVSANDLNADAYDDLFVSSGMCFPFRYCTNNVLLNDGGKRFADMEYVLGVEPRDADKRLQPWFELDGDGQDRDHPICQGRSGRIVVWSATGTRSSAMFDLDDDGDLDIVTNDFNSPPQVLVSDLSETKADLHFVKIALNGRQSNRDGLGAVVAVTSGGEERRKFNDGKSGYLSQSSMPLYFGLGESDHADRITVTWPSGKSQTLNGPIQANQRVTITEDEPAGTSRDS